MFFTIINTDKSGIEENVKYVAVYRQVDRFKKMFIQNVKKETKKSH